MKQFGVALGIIPIQCYKNLDFERWDNAVIFTCPPFVVSTLLVVYAAIFSGLENVPWGQQTVQVCVGV